MACCPALYRAGQVGFLALGESGLFPAQTSLGFGDCMPWCGPV